MLLLTLLFQHKLSHPKGIYNIYIYLYCWYYHDYWFKISNKHFILFWIFFSFYTRLENQGVDCVQYGQPDPQLHCCPYLFYAKPRISPSLSIIGSLVLVFDHDRQNQSCSVSNSTALALAVLLVFVPVQCNVKRFSFRMNSKVERCYDVCESAKASYSLAGP